MSSDEQIFRIQLQQLVSSNLPIGSYAYSQGMEWAIDEQWIIDELSLRAWLQDMLSGSIAHVDIPILFRLIKAFRERNACEAENWVDFLFACRETDELVEEEKFRGKAFQLVLRTLKIATNPNTENTIHKSQLAGFAAATCDFKLDTSEIICAWVWSWLENLTLCGVKLIPLGQSQGQKILFDLSNSITDAVAYGCALKDDELGYSSPALAIASSLHETQYTRLYRS